MKRTFLKFAAVAACAVVMTGCATGVKYQPLTGDGSISCETIDDIFPFRPAFACWLSRSTVGWLITTP